MRAAAGGSSGGDGGENGGGYIWRGARGLGEGATEAAAASWRWRTPAARRVLEEERATGRAVGWARPSRRGRVCFF